MDQGKNHSKQETYEELFVFFSDRVEKWLIRFAIFLAVLLVTVQIAMLHPAVRRAMVKVERLEGVPFWEKN